MAKSWFDRKHATPRQRLLFEQERAVLLATEEILRLTQPLCKSKAYVTQALSGGRNMTLRTLAEFVWACGASVRGFEFVPGGRAERAARAASAQRHGQRGQRGEGRFLYEADRFQGAPDCFLRGTFLLVELGNARLDAFGVSEDGFQYKP